MPTTSSPDVKAVAAWDGWCNPCQTERPLVLTEAGPRGVAAWLRGIGHEDRVLHLYCRVCGEHQLVPQDELDDPEVVLTVPDVLLALTRVGAAAVVLARAVPAAEVPSAPVLTVVPAPRQPVCQPVLVTVEGPRPGVAALAPLVSVAVHPYQHDDAMLELAGLELAAG